MNCFLGKIIPKGKNLNNMYLKEIFSREFIYCDMTSRLMYCIKQIMLKSYPLHSTTSKMLIHAI